MLLNNVMTQLNSLECFLRVGLISKKAFNCNRKQQTNVEQETRLHFYETLIIFTESFSILKLWKEKLQKH